MLVLCAACGGESGGGGEPALTPPVITTQPADTSVVVGAQATFSVAATGQELRYQWKHNGVDVAGANAASYTLTSAQIADSRSTWSVTVSNDAGSVNSATATLIVTRSGLLAGSPSASGHADGAGAGARFDRPSGVTVDGNGTLYVSDTFNSLLRRVSPAGEVTTVAGSVGKLYRPREAAIDAAGNVYIGEDLSVLKLTPAGVVSTVLTLPLPPGGGDPRSSVRMSVAGLALDGAGNLYVSNSVGIRKVAADGTVTLVEGVPYITAIGTALYGARGLAVHAATGVLYFASGNCTVSKMERDGSVSVLAGTAGACGLVDGTGADARFSHSMDLAVDTAGNVYVADVDNHAVRKITPAGVVTTIAGRSGVAGIAIDNADMLYVTGSHGVWKMQLVWTM
jgi:hypothetical protein